MQRVTPRFYVAAGGVALTLAGLLGPWMKVVGLFNFTVSGLDTGDGKMIGAAALGTAVLLGLHVRGSGTRKWLLPLVSLLGVGIAVTGVYDYNKISSALSSGEEAEFAAITVGWGLWAVIIGGITVALGSLATFLGSRNVEAPVVEAPVAESPVAQPIQ